MAFAVARAVSSADAFARMPPARASAIEVAAAEKE